MNWRDKATNRGSMWPNGESLKIREEYDRREAERERERQKKLRRARREK